MTSLANENPQSIYHCCYFSVYIFVHLLMTRGPVHENSCTGAGEVPQPGLPPLTAWELSGAGGDRRSGEGDTPITSLLLPLSVVQASASPDYLSLGRPLVFGQHHPRLACALGQPWASGGLRAGPTTPRTCHTPPSPTGIHKERLDLPLPLPRRG
uniref:Uncharacterized protein n=1 Tax=Pipistrellus kuhlii TaxID=59472 RepID=A0A7J7YX10_PIPKU|nr:hypothetical protein mPipKuh1_009853 [Pipistrellus kuhlii]